MTRMETLGVEGMVHCRVQPIEKRLMSLAAVKRAAVNSVMGSTTVEFDEKSIDLDGIQPRSAAAVTHVPACSGRIICKATDPLRDAAAFVPA